MSDVTSDSSLSGSARPLSRHQSETSSPLSDALSFDFSSSASDQNNLSPIPSSRRSEQQIRARASRRILSPTPRIPASTSRARPRIRLSCEQKLNLMVETLRRTKWTFEDFMAAWVGTDERSRNVMVYHTSYARLEQRREVMRKAADNLMDNKFWEEPDLYAKELDRLVEHEPFGKFTYEMSLESLNCDDAISVIRNKAPHWYRFLRTLCVNRRAGRKSYHQAKRDRAAHMIFTLTSMVCSARQKKNSTAFATCMDLYLQGSGVHRRVIETLSGLGLCHSYKSGLHSMDKLAEHAKRMLQLNARNPQAYAVYDNINFADRKRHEETGHKAKFHSFTNAAWVICNELPATGLTQSMHDATVPLKAEDVLLSNAIVNRGDEGARISRYFIAEAIQRLHTHAVNNSVFGGSQGQFPSFPVVEQVQPVKTQFWQLAGITADEGTVKGTYAVHDDIFLDQLGYQKAASSGTADDFTERLFLIHGDQLTTSRMRTVQHEQRHARLGYDRRKWLMGVPAWFHIQYNLLLTIVRTHWKPVGGETDIHCISSDATRWNRSQSSRDNVKYHLMEPIVAQGFTARTAALFYAAMQDKGLLYSYQDNYGRKEVLDEAIASLSANQFLELVEEVRVAAFTPEAWQGHHADIDFRTMCRYLQEIELLLTIRRAIKHADIGILRRMVEPLVIFFLGAGQTNYGREMLYYRWLLSSANTPELQLAILSSGLVNWRGHSGAYKPVDLALEHLNCACKIDLRNNKNSTHDVEIVFKRVALCNTWLRALRDKMETEYGESMPGTHTTSAAVPDMFLLAWTLYYAGLGSRRSHDNLPQQAMFNSADIRQTGVSLLEASIEKFNAEHVQRSAIGTVLPSVDGSDFVDISEFAEVVHPRFDAISDPTIDIARLSAVEQIDLTL